mgnify:CR=1 FL=1|jgi:hypothetical protein|tara:strand:+ start:1151 stop:1297 length:147 start_codon:yes stop_codon:yes gene_type:complete
MSFLFILPLYLLIFAVIPVIAAFVLLELIELLSSVYIKRSKKEQELFN